MRDQILNEIRRLAARDGSPPGRDKFTRETGISPSQWSGVIWARWGDALVEAGYAPNSLQPRRDATSLLREVAVACRSFGRFPSSQDMRLYRRTHPDFPSRAGIPRHFGSINELIHALHQWCDANPDYADVAAFLPEETPSSPSEGPIPPPRGKEGYVYLIKSGDHYKIGRSDDLERRVKQIKIALPEAATLIHAFSKARKALQGKGYARGFIPVNTKATNEHHDKKAMAYLVNVFHQPLIKGYFEDRGIPVHEDIHALSEMVQWLWRSGIRDGEAIYVFIPSERMRRLRTEWLWADDTVALIGHQKTEDVQQAA